MVHVCRKSCRTLFYEGCGMDFKELITRNDVADFLKISKGHLSYILYRTKVESYYHEFEIPKKVGGTRLICAPIGELKNIQRRLAKRLTDYYCNKIFKDGKRPNISHGFENKRSIITNAHVHRNKKYILNIDLENFFESINFGRVRGYFEKDRNFQIKRQAATVIAQLVCYKGALPQGAPTSPIITNLICRILDLRLLKLAKKFKMDYTRYADDLTFSTNNKNLIDEFEAFFVDLNAEIEKAGFKINIKKTRLVYKDSQQKVTGLIVNKKINVDRNYVRDTRAMAHSLYTKGNFSINGNVGTVEQLAGRFAFIDQIDKHNNVVDGLRHDAWHLSGREKDYQKFIFYSRFYASNVPLIVTEGKTDVRYIKAALMSLHNDYSNLVSARDDSFEFKIRFLKRTRILSYYFNLQHDGADTMKNISDFYGLGKAFKTNLASYLNRIGAGLGCPIFLLFDNEQKSDRPLKKFISENESRLASDFPKCLQENLCAKIAPENSDTNLYLLTVPLVDGKDKCAIEDLFDSDVRGHVIDGKQFTMNNNFNEQLYYGKEIFSKYVLNNYQSINFDNFRPMLDKISEIIDANSKGNDVQLDQCAACDLSETKAESSI